MDSDMTQAYATRVTQANRSQLIVIIYEIILDHIKSGIKAYENHDLETFDKDLKQAQKFVNELISTLDFKYPISFDLANLYLYTNKRIITAIIQRKPDSLESGIKVMESLYKGFLGVEKEDFSQPLMENIQQVYAGLTYGKGALNETFIDSKEETRGFRA